MNALHIYEINKTESALGVTEKKDDKFLARSLNKKRIKIFFFNRVLAKNYSLVVDVHLLSITSSLCVSLVLAGHTLDFILFINEEAITTFLSRPKIRFFLFPRAEDKEASPANELSNSAKKRLRIWNDMQCYRSRKSSFSDLKKQKKNDLF